MTATVCADEPTVVILESHFRLVRRSETVGADTPIGAESIGSDGRCRAASTLLSVAVMGRRRTRNLLRRAVFAVVTLSVLTLAVIGRPTTPPVSPVAQHFAAAPIPAYRTAAAAAAPVATAAPATEDPATAAVVAALIGRDPSAAMAHLPASFRSVMGYRPVVERMRDGSYPVNPHGGCSSPVPLPSRFEPFCRTHDFGYDLLRYADRIGRPLGGWARLGLDAMLVRRMAASCGGPLCTASARAARIALRINTWRQFDGAPIPRESVVRIVASLGERGIESVAGQR